MPGLAPFKTMASMPEATCWEPKFQAWPAAPLRGFELGLRRGCGVDLLDQGRRRILLGRGRIGAKLGLLGLGLHPLDDLVVGRARRLQQGELLRQMGQNLGRVVVGIARSCP